MATDKTVTIKAATDAQLESLLARLRKEVEAQRIISELIRNSTPEKVDMYGNKDYTYPTVSTEAPIESMYHIGIPGMKWGVRKRRGSSTPGRIPKGSGGKIDKTFLGVSREHIRARELNAKGKRHLSNAELKELTTRMDLEAKYNKLNPSKLKKGMAIATAVLAVGTTAKTAYDLAKSPMGQEIKQILNNTAKKAR